MDRINKDNAMCIEIVGDPNVGLLLGIRPLDKREHVLVKKIKTAWSPGGVRGLLTMSYG
jgi:hypothetical protein